MLHLYYGADDFSLREAMRDLRASLDNDGMLSTNTTELSPRGLAPGLLVQHLSTMPFLASARLVVVEGLVPAAGSGRRAVTEWQPMLDALPVLPPSNHLLLLEPFAGRDQAAAFGRSALARTLREVPDADVREFRELRPYASRGRENEVAAWVRRRTADRGIAIEPGAVDLLVELVGNNLWVVAAEIEKLSRYAAGRPITDADVRALTPEAQEANVFAIVDAVVEGRGHVALRHARQMLTQGTFTAAYVQAMIARQFRSLVRAGELIERGEPSRAIGEATGVTNDYALRKMVEQARRVGRAAPEAGLRAIEASDHAVKTGTMTDAVAIELLIVRLAALCGRAARSGSGARPARAR